MSVCASAYSDALNPLQPFRGVAADLELLQFWPMEGNGDTMSF